MISTTLVENNNDENNVNIVADTTKTFCNAYENDDNEATNDDSNYESIITNQSQQQQQQKFDTINSIVERRTIQCNNNDDNNNNHNNSDFDVEYTIIQKNDLNIKNTIQKNNETTTSRTKTKSNLMLNRLQVIDPNSITQQHESQQQQQQQHHDENINDNDTETWINILFISSYGIIGTLLRYYFGRLFGYDCEMKLLVGNNNDFFFQKISSNICITSSGTTVQTGGSLFIDLPANMIGSFIMGMLSPSTGQHTIPWFRSDHHLQHNKYFHNGLRIGTCGCLTTFSSWNTQMVIMLDGTGTVLGSQILSAVFGYIIGILCSLSSFNSGRTVSEWMKRIHHVPNNNNDDNDNEDDVIDVVLPSTTEQRENVDTYNKYDKKTHQVQKRCNIVKFLFNCCNQLYCVNYGVQVLALLLIIAFVVSDFVYGLHMYRSVWLSLVVSPFGSIVRWKLSYYNNISSSQCNSNNNIMQWFPFGTFVCNVGAATVSIVVAAIQYKLSLRHNNGSTSNDNNNNTNIWKIAILSAISTGWAGSTSTVSTLVREMADATTPFHSFIYCFVTIVSSAVVGLLLYRPIAR